MRNQTCHKYNYGVIAQLGEHCTCNAEVVGLRPSNSTINLLEMLMSPKIKIVFAPDALDDFEGTQEELDNLINEIVNVVSSNATLQSNLLSSEAFEDGMQGSIFIEDSRYKRTLH